jgi:hypothetical protein
MIPERRPVAHFVLRALLWLPLSFAAWYFSAPATSALAGWAARAYLWVFRSGMVTAVEQAGTTLTYVTNISVRHAQGTNAILVPEVTTLIYTCGLPVFMALVLAERIWSWKVAAGLAVLVLFQGWSIAFDVLAQLGLQAGADAGAQLAMTGWRAEAVAIAYQAGALMLPTLVPVLAWAVMSPLIRDSVAGARVDFAEH